MKNRTALSYKNKAKFGVISDPEIFIHLNNRQPKPLKVKKLNKNLRFGEKNRVFAYTSS